MTNLVKLELQQELLKLCRLIGRTSDLAQLRDHFIRANGLWARIERLTDDPPKSA